MRMAQGEQRVKISVMSSENREKIGVGELGQ